MRQIPLADESEVPRPSRPFEETNKKSKAVDLLRLSNDGEAAGADAPEELTSW